jgi:MFS family permease
VPCSLQINNFFGQSSFINHFGFTDAAGKKYIPADWQAAINNANNIGSIIGLAINGWAQSRFGSRRVYMVTMVLMTGFSEFGRGLRYTLCATVLYVVGADEASLRPCLCHVSSDALRWRSTLRYPLGYPS